MASKPAAKDAPKKKSEKPSFDFSVEPDLFKFAKILRDCHSNDNSSEETEDAVRQIVDYTLLALSQLFHGEPVLATVRSRSGHKEHSLRPVCSFPNSLDSYFLDPETYTDFKFEVTAFPCGEDGKPDYYELVLPAIKSSNPPYMFMRGYDDLTSGKKHKRNLFSRRIYDFITHVKNNKNEYQDVHPSFDEIEQIGYCLVFARSENRKKISNIFAVYLTPTEIGKQSKYDAMFNGESTETIRKRNIAACVVSAMFDALDDCVQRGQLSLRKDALKEITRLIPIFSNREKAPANAMMELVAAFNAVFRRHPFIGPASLTNKTSLNEKSENNNPEDNNPERIWVRFIQIDAAITSDGKDASPSLRVYPKALADMNRFGAYQFAHKATISVVKLLLFNWLFQEWNPLTYSLSGGDADGLPINCSSEFANLFENTAVLDCVNKDKNKFFPQFPNKVPCIIASVGDGNQSKKVDVWEALNQDVAAGKFKTKTTAAFLLTRGGKIKYPYACLAFESAFPDAFSTSDLELLSDLSAACAPLISNLQIGSTHHNYANLLRRAFNSREKGVFDIKLFSEFSFEIHRLDPKAYISIATNKERLKKFWVLSGPHAVSTWDEASPFLDEISALCEITSKKPADTEIEEDCNVWLEKILKRLVTSGNRPEQDRFSHQLPDMLAFLEAIPPNSRWHAYLSAIPRALHERDGEMLAPNLSLYTAGHSAQQIFVLNDKSKKIRQILKLGHRKDIAKEVHNYCKHVRFDVPLAARISPDGFAYESDGYIESSGDQAANTAQFGVVVSDLVSGVEERDTVPGPQSFDDQMLKIFKEADGLELSQKSGSENILAVLFALKHHFVRNVAAWEESVTEKEKADADLIPLDTVRKAFDGKTKGAFCALLEHSSEAMPGLANCAIAAIRAYNRFAFSNKNNKLITLATELQHQMVQESSSSALMLLIMRLFGACEATVTSGGSIKPGIAVAGQFPVAYVHGDLNGRNLTWASDYQKFFLIDFENVCPSYKGVDQLKLIAAFLSEAPTLLVRNMEEEPEAKWILDCHAELISLIKFLASVSVNGPMALEPQFKPYNKDNTRPGIFVPIKYGNRNAGAWNGQVFSTIIFNILRTMDDKVLKNWSPQNSFWRYALTTAFLKQLEYSIDNFLEHCAKPELDDLEFVTAALVNDKLPIEEALYNVPPIGGGLALKLAYAIFGVLACIYGRDD